MGHAWVPRVGDDAFEGVCPFHGDCLEGLASAIAMRERWGRPPEEIPPDHPAWRLEASYLALGLVNVALTLSPQRIILGGGLVGNESLLPVVRAGAVLAATGSLLGLVLGVSRTTFAMARDGYLPRALDRVHPAYRVPHRAEVAVGVVVALAVLAGDVRQAIGFSSVCVLAYYAIANASAWTLDASVRARLVPALGIVGCVAVGLALPMASAYVADLAPPHMRGRYMGVNGMTWALSLILGPALGMKLLVFSAGAFWLVCGVLGLLAALVIFVPVNSTRPALALSIEEKA